MRSYSTGILLLFGFLLPCLCQAQSRTHVLEQTEAPIVIYDYEAENDGPARRQGDRIVHSIQFSNNADTTTVAIEFGLISYNAFNDLLDVTYGITMDQIEPVGKSRGRGSAEFSTSPPSAFSFYTGVVYVSRVRLKGETIWEANADRVVSKVKEIIGKEESGLEPDSLQNRRNPISI